jgi:hypothetical protein
LPSANEAIRFYWSINIAKPHNNTFANLPHTGLKANKIVTIPIGFQDFGEGIDTMKEIFRDDSS